MSISEKYNWAAAPKLYDPNAPNAFGGPIKATMFMSTGETHRCQCQSTLKYDPRVWQCKKNATAQEVVEGKLVWVCNIHKASQYSARQQKREARYNAELAMRKQAGKERREELDKLHAYGLYKAALTKIAASPYAHERIKEVATDALKAGGDLK